MAVDLVVTLIVALPLLAAVVNGINLLMGDRLHYQVVQRVTCGSILLSFIGAVWVFAQVLADPAPREIIVYRWLFSDDLNINVAFLIDSLSGVMMLVVTGFSFLIAVFSINYMHNDRSFTRYFTIFALFVFAMLVLVMGNNYGMLFLGWEAVGVCSYLLIGHYYHRPSAAQAGTQAFVLNRVGDAGFLMGIFLIATNFKTLNYSEVFAQLETIDSATATAICLCLLLGAVGKSAQLPLGTWLAKAMEGPTPSSALIHAATMVTAGIYMIVRSHDLYNMAPNALLVVALIGGATALYGSLVGLTLPDIKGILAASTTTQLGLMFLACGLGAYAVAIFHLVAHAFLKSYLFLTAPSILHHMHTKADPNKTEETRKPVPLIYGVTLVLSLGLVAVPFLAGWWRSDPAGGLATLPSFVLVAAGVMAAFSVLYYVTRLTRKVFIEEAHDAHGEGHSLQSLMVGPMVVLVLSASIGLVLGLLPGGMENTWFKEFMQPVVAVQSLSSGGSQILAFSLVGLLALMLLSSWVNALYFERFKPELPGWGMLKARGVYNLVMNRFWLDELYARFFIQPIQAIGHFLDRLDTRIIDRAVGAPSSEPKLSTAALTWEQQYLAIVATGTSPSLAQTTAPTTTVEDEERGEDKALAGETLGLVGWLTKVSAGTSAWAERRVVGQATGVIGGMMGFTAAIAGGVEKWIVGSVAGAMGGVTGFAAAIVGGMERQIVRPATAVIGGERKAATLDGKQEAAKEKPVFDFNKWMGELNAKTAEFAGFVEKRVFDVGVNKGVVMVTGLVGRALVWTEEHLSRPAVTGFILVASVVAVMVGVYL